MKILHNRYLNPNIVLIVMIGFGFLFGSLNTYHRYPSTSDMYPDLVTITFVSIGLIYWYAASQVKAIGLATLAWVAAFGMIAIQPYINPITYPTGLIFDLSVILSAIAISIAIANTEHKTKLLKVLMIVVVSGSILTVLTQLVQYMRLELPKYLLFPNVGSTRIYGNVAQPNQAAFILTLGTSGLLYLSSLANSHFKSIILILPSFLFAIGLGLSASRTGLILMAIAILGYVLLFKLPIRTKIVTGSICALLLLLGYSLGSQLLVNYNSVALSAMERLLTNSSTDIRWLLSKQAWLLFLEQPITGVGWGNLMGASLDRAQQLTWFSATAHSHFFITNIAAETGIIGLLILCPFAYILLKNFSFRPSNAKATIYILLAIFIAYSSSEFPLWVPRYLIVFVVLLGLIDSKTFTISIKMSQLIKYGFLSVSIILALGSIYYQINYRTYSKVFYAVAEPSFSYEEKEQRLLKLSPVIGFEQFHDILLFHLMPENTDNVEYKAQLTDRVLSHTLSYDVLVKSANIHLLADNKPRALELYKAACLFRYAKNCKKLTKDLNNKAKNDLGYQTINRDFHTWRAENPKRTGLIKDNTL